MTNGEVFGRHNGVEKRGFDRLLCESRMHFFGFSVHELV